MANKHHLLHIALMMCFVVAFHAHADTYEPDLTDVSIDVDYTLGVDGRWNYHYTIGNGSDVVVRSLLIDLSCDSGTLLSDDISSHGQGEGYLDPSKYPGIERLRDREHVPARIEASPGSAAYWGVTMKNEAYWLVLAKPGSDTQGLVLISKGSPMMRRYYITPDFAPLPDDDEHYPHLEEEEDYNLYGLIMGPSCHEGTDIPDDDHPDPIFAGTPPREVGVNHLLTYSEPLQSRFTVAASENRVAMTVHYADEMDPDSFRVEPGWARELFSPKPGSSETVILPLNMGLNRFSLLVYGIGSTPNDWTYRDQDIFEIRRGRTPPGQAKRQ